MRIVRHYAPDEARQLAALAWLLTQPAKHGADAASEAVRRPETSGSPSPQAPTQRGKTRRRREAVA